jgi:hypothetical protein
MHMLTFFMHVPTYYVRMGPQTLGKIRRDVSWLLQMALTPKEPEQPLRNAKLRASQA